MSERATSGHWRSVHGKDGGHYNTYALDSDENGMAALREFFPDGEANKMNLCFFSTSGVHGSYSTIEEHEEAAGLPDDHDDKPLDLTFVIVQPRIVTMRYGNCCPRTVDDLAFLKKLRASSWAASQTVGASEPATPEVP